MPTPQTGPGKGVSFRLSGGGAPTNLTLPINPEEAQRSSPARITTTQTLGGIFQDIDGIGLQTIMLQGTTGWRGKNGIDGMLYMEKLYKEIYEEYYRRVKRGTIPELLLIDGVNNYTYKVTMDDFQLQRSRSEPLLFRYTIPMTIVQNMNDPPDPNDEEDPVPSVPPAVKNPTPTVQKAVQTSQKHQPSPRKYKVKSGDTLSGISKKFYGTVSKYHMLAQVNHIKNPNLIFIGQILTIPY